MTGPRVTALDALAGPGVGSHELIARCLRGLGVTHVYGITGTPLHETFAACSLAGVRPIAVRHQSAAAFAAAAHCHLAGELRAAVLVSAGPAVTNTATGVLLARDNGWPLLVLGGRRAVTVGRSGQFQDLDAVPVMAPLCKYAATVERSEALPGALQAAADAAVSGRPGPVYLDLAEEGLAGVVRAPAIPVAPQRAPAELDAVVLERAAALLREAQRPLVLIGREARWGSPWTALRTLVERLQAPFVTANTARGYLPDDHALCVNEASGRAQASADTVLAIGTRFDWEYRFGAHLAADARVIRVEVEADAANVRVKSEVFLVGDLGSAVSALARSVSSVAQRSAWADALVARARERRAELRVTGGGSSGSMSMHNAMATLAATLPADAFTVFDGNVSMLTAQQVIACNEPLARLSSGANGTMGVGIPFAIAAKLLHPRRPVVAVCGDSAFGFSAMELETAVRHRIPITVVVMNNQGSSGGLIQSAHYPPGHERVAMLGEQVRNERVMEAFGGFAARAATPGELRTALERALARDAPACIDCVVDPMSVLPAHTNY